MDSALVDQLLFPTCFLARIAPLVKADQLHRFTTLAAKKKFLLINHTRFKQSVTHLIQLVCQLDSVQLDYRSKVFFAEEKSSLPPIQEELIQTLDRLIDQMSPWRKGPYFLYHRRIESEWESRHKWNRMKDHLPNLKGKRICDLGCNNGYFSFRLLDLPEAVRPNLILGLDPTPLYYLQYLLLKLFRPQKIIENYCFELMGYQELTFFKPNFDLIFCLGILYHHPNPIEILKLIHQSLTPKGEVWIDCQGITLSDQSLPVALFPEKTYTGKKGFWFLPNLSSLKNWLIRSGFVNLKVMFQEPLDLEEQRRSQDAPYSSLKEGMDCSSIERTIEGYPRPIRIYLKANKG